MTTGLDSQRQTLASFDWQWANLARGDFMPGDPWFDANAARVLARELCAIDADWFVGKRMLDAGCGQGRWTRALLELGADVTAVDFSEAGLRRTRDLCGSSPRLRTRRANLLEIPPDLARERFDLVFSFGVLHHTGDTYRALTNIATLVADTGALFLYLYGVRSWSDRQRRQVEGLRLELASLAFDQKVREIQRRFPGEDPHQLFDLLSPTVNDRVEFDDVASKLNQLGFSEIAQTVESGEVYVRATRPGFPRDARLEPVGPSGAYVREVTARWTLRKAAARDDQLRKRLLGLPQRARRWQLAGLAEVPRVPLLDLSYAPDASSNAMWPSGSTPWEGPSPILPGWADTERGELLCCLGGGVSGCGHPEAMVEAMVKMTATGGTAVIELPPEPARMPTRTMLDKVLDYRRPVADKTARLLERHPTWTTVEALYALGGPVLAPPLSVEAATVAARRGGASSVAIRPAGHAIMLVATRA